MSDIEPRPRPQYGEYATPEEQRARIQRPEVTEALEAGVAPQPEKQRDTPAVAAPAATTAAATGATPGTAAAAVKRGPLIDRIASLGLLGYGLVTVITNIAQLLDFPAFAEQAARTLGITASFTNLTAGYVWGAVAAAIYGIGWLATAVLTWRRLKTGRVSFWIPLVGFVATTLLATVCVFIALSGDPGYMSALTDGLLR